MNIMYINIMRNHFSYQNIRPALLEASRDTKKLILMLHSKKEFMKNDQNSCTYTIYLFTTPCPGP